MSPLLFYNVGTDGPRSPQRAAIILVRRTLRRILRPIFHRLVEILQSLCDRLDAAERSDAEIRAELARLTRRHEALVEQNQVGLAFGWDYVALVRRVAVLEDRIEELTARAEGQPPIPLSKAG